MNCIVSNAKEVERISESEMLLHPRTMKPTAVFWMIIALVFIIIYYFTTTNSETDSQNVHPKLLVNGPDVDRKFQQEFQEQNKQAVVLADGGLKDNSFERPIATVQAPNVNQQPVQNVPQVIPELPPVIPIDVLHKPVARRGGFAHPLPMHREPEELRNEVQEGLLNLGHGLNLRKDVNPDYIDAALHNQNKDSPIFPKFNPNNYVQDKKLEDYASVRRPDPKSFPVTINLSPNVPSCQKPVIVVLVTTTIKEARLRATIRRTWGKKANVDQPGKIEGDWKVYFLMGLPQNTTQNEAIVIESELNNDIIQGDFVDMAEEETRKVLMGMMWIVERMSLLYNCQPMHVLRAEADMYINMPSIFEWLKKQQHSNLYIGHVIRGNYPNRDVESPFYVAKSDYPRSNLPDYAESPVYFISYDNIKRFLGAVSSVTPIAMDGAYIGLLAENVGAKPTKNEHFVLMKRPYNVCLYKHMFFIFKVTENELIYIYNVVERHYKKRECSRTDF